MSRGVAAVVTEAGGAPVLRAVEVADPGRGQVLVRTLASGVCHTDLAGVDGAAGFGFPALLGHEGAGVVEAVGPGVVGVRAGDRVVLGFDSCGACAPCTEGHPAYCAEFGRRNRTPVLDAVTDVASGAPVRTGWMGQSAWAGRVLVHERAVVVLPADVPAVVAAPLGCSVVTGAGTVWNVLRPAPGDRLLVLGAGAVGLAAVMAAAAEGCAVVVACDPVPARRALALACGATHAVAPEDLPALLRGPVGPVGPVRHVVDTVGTEQALDAALAALAPRGTCATLALRPGADRVPVSQGRLLWGRTLTGVIEGDAVLARDVPRLVALWREGRLPLERLVREYAPDEVARAVEDTRTGAVVKAVLVGPWVDRSGLADGLRAGSLGPGEATADELAALWRSLPAVAPDELRGLWRGRAVPTGHRTERLLRRHRWYGKRFVTADDVDPLVVVADDGTLVSDRELGGGGATLRTVERDGVVTAAMAYDGRPVVDAFVRLGPDAVLGVMDGQDALDRGEHLYFVLERDPHPRPVHRPAARVAAPAAGRED